MPNKKYLGDNVFGEGSSDVGCDSIPKVQESDQAHGLYDVKNDGCSKRMNALEISGGHVVEAPCGLQLSYRLKNLSVSQKYPDLAFIGDDDFSKNVDAQDLSEADCHEHLSDIDVQLAKNLSGSGNSFDLPYTNNDGLSYNGIGQPVQFPELLYSQNDYLSQHLGTHNCSAVDNVNGSSAIDLTNAAQTFSVSTEVSEPSAENYDFPDMSCQHLSRSGSLATTGSIGIEDQSELDQNGRSDPDDFDSEPTTFPDAINPSPQRWSFRKTKSRQDAKTVKGKRNPRRGDKVSLNLDPCKIPRKRRSQPGKRARVSSWGLLSNLELNFVKNSDYCTNLTEPEKPSRSRGQASGKQEKNPSNTHSANVRRKRSRRIGGISVKSKVGVRVVPRSMMDVNNEEPFQLKGKTLGLFNEEEITKSMASEHFNANQKKMVRLSDDTVYGGIKSFVENISNSGSDLGTSPDSEVINLNPDTCLWGNIEEEFHNISGSSQVCLASDGVTCLVPKNSEEAHEPMESGMMDNDRQSAKRGEIAAVVPYFTNVSASSSSNIVPQSTYISEQKSKEQSSTAAKNKSRCVPSADFGTEVTPRIVFDLQSPEVSAKVRPNSKAQKVLNGGKMDGVKTIGSDIHHSAKKGLCNSKKKVTRDKLASKHKLKVKLRGGVTSSETERQAVAGYSKLDGSGESGTAKASLIEESTFNVEPRGSAEQSKKPRNAWVLCDDCQKWRRIPAMLADKIEEANCSWTCKDNVDTNFGNCSIPQEKSDAEINTELEISDASSDEGVWDANEDHNNFEENQSTVTQQSTWKLIKSNQFLHRSQRKQTIDEIMVCHCKPPSDGQLGCGDGCLNRMLNIECVQGTCPCGELCSNQQFQNRKYARLKMFKCGKKGYGLQVLDNISEGQFLIEYIGEVLDMHSYEARQKDYAMQGHKHFYFMTLNGSEVIDACAKGNLGRFINHSCDPNCSTEKWMVNGEVCIGLFALKNIKKGEELTFDYNYVRVFGAAAKKCVCGSSQCRGYIGGQSQDSEIVVQDDSEDEYPEPVMVCEDGAVDESNPDLLSPLRTFDGIQDMPDKEPQKAVDVMKPRDFPTSLQAFEPGLSKKVVNNELGSVVEHEDTVEERVSPLNTYVSTELKADTSEKSGHPCETTARAKLSFKQDDTSTETLMTTDPEHFAATENMKQSPCVIPEENSASLVINQLVSDVIDSKKKSKSSSGKGSIKSPVKKASRLTSSIKREKFKSNPVNLLRLHEKRGKDDVLSSKHKKEFEVSSTGRFEAVHQKLNELLNSDGGISKRKDASRGYLKLLLLTAASGDSCNGEAIQSNRHLSMILGALLETKSRTVLVDIINKNGLQMLHNMLKRSRKEFNKTPILRKLLKVFEYLATRKILTSEHISGGPTCPGVESFRESILSLTEHSDKQVHQIARNFRDRWIPRATRWHQREDCRMDFRPSSEHCRYSEHKKTNQAEKYLESSDYVTKSGVTPTTFDSGIFAGSCQLSGSGVNTRKRKSRWDQSEDLKRVDNHMADDGTHSIDDDLPPGFAVPGDTTVVSSEVCSYSSQDSPTTNINHTCEVVSGQPQLRFISCLPVSYGVPLGLVKDVDMPQTTTFEGLSVAPGMPFHPFPPLPPYPHNTCKSAPNAVDSAVMGQPAHDQNRSGAGNLGANSPILRGASIPAMEMPITENRLDCQQSRGVNTSGRKYFRPHKWNSSKLGPPWIRNRNNWGLTGNNLRNGMNRVGLEIPGDEFREWHGRGRDMYYQPHERFN